MKLVFCLATLLIATSLCEAYSGPKNVTRRLEREVNSYFSQLENQVVSEMKNYRGAIQSNVQSYLSEYSKLRERIGRELNQVGPQGQLIARQIAADVKGMIASVKAAFNQKVIQSKAQQVLSYVKANYIDPLKADLGLLKNAVAENPSAIECWDENKAALRGIVDSVASQAKSAIDSNLNGLDVEADMLVAKIGAAVARIETQIRSTCTNSDCVVDYVRKTSIYRDM